MSEPIDSRFIPTTGLTYEQMAERALSDPAFRLGLLAAADVCRAQGVDHSKPPCPSEVAAVYIDRIARGEQP